MIDQKLIISARQFNMKQYLLSRGEQVVKEGNQYRVKDKSGLMIKNNMWYNHSLRIGGNTIDYLMKIENYSFKEAVAILTNTCMFNEEIASTKSTYEYKLDDSCEKLYDNNYKTISIPPKNNNNKRVVAYLLKARKLNPKIVFGLIKNNLIYEAKTYNNAVFIGFDNDENIKYAFLRSSNSFYNFKCEAKGSDKRHSFNIKGNTKTLYVFESPIDLLSYTSIQNKPLEQKDHLLSLGGVSETALEYYISSNEIKNIILCLDNDPVGKKASESLKKKYSHKGFSVCMNFPSAKDWNDDLLRLAK